MAKCLSIIVIILQMKKFIRHLIIIFAKITSKAIRATSNIQTVYFTGDTIIIHEVDVAENIPFTPGI